MEMEDGGSYKNKMGQLCFKCCEKKKLQIPFKDKHTKSITLSLPYCVTYGKADSSNTAWLGVGETNTTLRA